MTEAAESKVADAVPAAESSQYHPPQAQPNRLNQALMWVGIVAGTLFIVATIFFSGFLLGCSGHYGTHHEGSDTPMGPGAQMGPGGMMGPGGKPGGMMGPGGKPGGMMGPGGKPGRMMGPGGPMRPATQSPAPNPPSSTTPRP